MKLLSTNGKITLARIDMTEVALLVVSALDLKLGLPAAVRGIFTALVVLIKERRFPLEPVGQICWSVLPLVAGLFGLMEVLDRTGVIHELSAWMQQGTQQNPSTAAGVSGLVVGFGSNAVNNLPAGLIANATALQAHVP